MDGRKLTTTAALGAALGVGVLIGAIVLSPAAGLAASANGGAVAICAHVLGAGLVAEAAEVIGIEPSELLAELRGGRTIAEVGEANGVDVDAVIDAVVAAERDRLDELVDDGRLTQAEADELADGLEDRVTDLVNGERPLRMPWGRPGLWGFADGPVAAAAEAIGIEPAELLEAVRGGQTVAEVAEAKGVEVDEVIDAVVASLQERLDDAVENGWLTQDEADHRAAELEEEATDLVNGELPRLPPLPGFPGRDRDHDGPLGRPWPDLDPDTNAAEPST